MSLAVHPESRPTNIRYVVLALTTMVAVLLYVDRICLSMVASTVKIDLSLSDDDMSYVLGSFFLTYAFAQVPAGWLSDRYGGRFMLGLYLAGWSLFTGFLGFAYSWAALIALRLGCGLFEAGAYPAAVGIVGRWFPFERRGVASGVVSVGGRLGGAAAPILTVGLVGLLGGWRPAMVAFGVVGVLVACVFWGFFRNRPRQHPACNAAEIALIEGDDGNRDGAPPLSWPPFTYFLLSRGLWISSATQFLTNLGWAFLITWLPSYLKEKYFVESTTLSLMASLPIFVGMAGMYGGGWLTDHWTARVGRRWGGAAPLALARFMVAGGFVMCLFIDAPWPITCAMALVAFSTDLGTPAIWAYCLDVGGKHVGSVLGWSNMWGNIGAALSPYLLNKILREYGSDAMFGACAGALFLSGVLALFLDATKPIVPADSLAA